MTKIDISKIKPGDQVQVANGDWYEVDIAADSGRIYIARHICAGNVSGLITAHKAAAAHEPVAAWVTEEELINDGLFSVVSEGKLQARRINKLLTSKYGPPPVIKTATGEEEGDDWVLADTGIWELILRRYLDPGDRYVELPKCCGESPCHP